MPFIAKRTLVCGLRPPAFDRESGGRRLFDLISILRHSGSEVAFLSPKGPVEARYRAVLERMGVRVHTGTESECWGTIRSGAFELAILAYWQVAELYLPMIRSASPATRVMIDSVDVHFLREIRESFVNANGNGGLALEIGIRMARELGVYGQADAVITVSQAERQFLASFMGNYDSCFVVPDMEALPVSPLAFHERKNILFVGNFWHRPNIDAVRYLCESVAPRLDPRVLDGHQIMIAGNGAEEEISTITAACRAARAVGWLPSLQAHLCCARLSVAPLRFGAGTKRKILQSLAAGTPVVSTSLGIEGLALRDGQHVLVADTPLEFSRAVERLMQDESLWSAMSAQGREYVKRYHSPGVVRARLQQAIESCRHTGNTQAFPKKFLEFPRTSPLGASPGPQDHRSILFSAEMVASRRPEVALDQLPRGTRRAVAGKRVLVLGVYAADRATNVADIVSSLSEPSGMFVTQRWAALGGPAPTQAVHAVTRLRLAAGPKWEIIAALMTPGDFKRFDFVVVCDDDIVLPERFLSAFLSLQQSLGFAAAQPARTHGSFLDWPITEKQEGSLARETRFVEGGPVVSFHRASYPFVFPLDLRSPMGWGYGAVWSHTLGSAGLKMGIIDAVPVDHGLRPQVTHYDRRVAERQRAILLSGKDHRPYDECFTVLDVKPSDRRSRTAKTWNRGRDICPLISVVVATCNRAHLLAECLASLNAQTVRSDTFEVIVVDDGSEDDTPRVVRSARNPSLSYFRLSHAGRASAKNLGIFAARAPILLLFDDDDIAGPEMLEQHLAAHAEHTQETVAVLGYTGWAHRLEVTPVMEYATGVGQTIFSYGSLKAEDRLGFAHFWEGRLSCKRSFLVRRGVHNQSLEYLIDIELGYRLSRHGLVVLYRPQAVSFMNRSVSFSDLCKRAAAKGRALHGLWLLHGKDPLIKEYCDPDRHSRMWKEFDMQWPQVRGRVEALESFPAKHSDPVLRAELHGLYRAAFAGFLSVGFMSAAGTCAYPKFDQEQRPRTEAFALHLANEPG